MQESFRNIRDPQASSYSDSTSPYMSSFVPTVSTNDTVSDSTLSVPASLLSASMNTTYPEFDSQSLCD